jgi:hypothetical protein
MEIHVISDCLSISVADSSQHQNFVTPYSHQSQAFPVTIPASLAYFKYGDDSTSSASRAASRKSGLCRDGY